MWKSEDMLVKGAMFFREYKLFDIFHPLLKLLVPIFLFDNNYNNE